MIPDKLPPQSIEAETMLIGEMLIDQRIIPEILQLVTPEMFSNTRHQELVNGIIQLQRDNVAVDMLTLFKHFKGHERYNEFAHLIAQITNNIATTINAKEHAAIIIERYIQREMIKLSLDVQNLCYTDGDPLTIFQLVEDTMNRLRNTSKDNMRHISEVISEVISIMQRNQEGEKSIVGVPTGFTEYDSMAGGLQDGELIIIAGETSQGKTALAMNIAINAAVEYNKKVAVLTLEMTDRQLTARAMSVKSGINSKSLLQHKIEWLNWQTFHKSINSLINAKIFVDHVANSDKSYIETTIRNAVSKHQVDLVIIDYLQLIRNTKRNRSTADLVAEIANDMKALAKAIGKPIILISQLSRDRDNIKPSLSRLKNSGDIENAADVVWFVWRPETYDKFKGVMTHDISGRPYSLDRLAHCIIAKGRNIGMFDFPLLFDRSLTRFENYIETQSTYFDNDNPFK